jgi:hypothetical protein
MSRAWCRWCGAEIRWAKTTNDKNIPLDPCPTLDGRWRISLGRAHYAYGVAREQARIAGERLYVAHMETCTRKTHQPNPRKTR